MKEPRTKPEAPLPKVLHRSVRTMKGKISLSTSLDNFNKTSHAVKTLKQPEDKQQHASPEQYATEKTTEAGGRVTRQVSDKTAGVAKKAAKKGYEKIRQQYDIKQRDKTEKASADDVKNQRSRSQTQHEVRNSAKTKQAASRSTKIRETQSGKKTLKNAIHTGKKANRSARTAKKSVKNIKRAVKATSKGIKTAAKTAKRTAQAAKRAAIIAKKAAVAAAKVAKLTVKAIIMAVKAAIAVIKGLMDKNNQERISSLKHELKKLGNGVEYMSAFMQSFCKYQGISELTREVIASLVERILISADKSIRIEFKFADEMQKYAPLCDDMVMNG